MTDLTKLRAELRACETCFNWRRLEKPVWANTDGGPPKLCEGQCRHLDHVTEDDRYCVTPKSYVCARWLPGGSNGND